MIDDQKNEDGKEWSPERRATFQSGYRASMLRMLEDWMRISEFAESDKKDVYEVFARAERRGPEGREKQINGELRGLPEFIEKPSSHGRPCKPTDQEADTNAVITWQDPNGKNHTGRAAWGPWFGPGSCIIEPLGGEDQRNTKAHGGYMFDLWVWMTPSGDLYRWRKPTSLFIHNARHFIGFGELALKMCQQFKKETP